MINDSILQESVNRKQSRTAFVGVDLFDGVRGSVDATVIISGERIAAVGSAAEVDTSGCSIIDGRDLFLMPGLIDSHIHAFNDALEKCLRYGVTTVLDMFCDPAWAIARRREQASRSIFDRADMWSAGMVAAARGGHGSEYGMVIPEVNGPADASRFVANRLAEGSDWIKIIYESPLRDSSVVDADTMAALVDAAHAAGVLAVVHPGGVAQAESALAAGADVLAHTCIDGYFSDHAIEIASHNKSAIIPTLVILKKACDLRRKSSVTTWSYTPADIKQSSRGYGWAVDSVRRMYDNDISILAGSDAPNLDVPWGRGLHREIELLVAAGLSEVDALAAATSKPATIFGLADRGHLAAGAVADLLVLARNPLKDIKATRAIERVYKRGVRRI